MGIGCRLSMPRKVLSRRQDTGFLETAKHSQPHASDAAWVLTEGSVPDDGVCGVGIDVQNRRQVPVEPRGVKFSAHGPGDCLGHVGISDLTQDGSRGRGQEWRGEPDDPAARMNLWLEVTPETNMWAPALKIDGKPVHEQEHVRADTLSLPVLVDIPKTARQLTLEVDYGDANDTQDHFNWIEPALLRPGRFDRQVVVPLPDIRGREQILLVHMRKVPIAPDVDASIIARGTPGFSGADLANLVNEAALFAADLTVPLVLVIGGEEHGLRHLTKTRCDLIVRIPSRGKVASLNASAAAAVCLFEVARQRRQMAR